MAVAPVTPAVGAASPGARTAYARLRNELPKSFAGSIKPVRTSILYKVWILITAIVMVILPLVYFGLIGIVAFGVYLHATESVGVFQEMRSTRAAMAYYLTPLVIGLGLIFFMLKPVLARPSGEMPARALKPEDEPLLFEFVECLCDIVRAPMPTRIEVNCVSNASAGIYGGLWGLLTRRLTLTIGLPLVSGLNLRQLTGVLAHEFGHFAQGGGMGLTYLVGTINNWFARVVYERDVWDERLSGLTKSGIAWAVIVAHVMIFFIWLTRRILWVLMLIARAISSFLSRQMEFDADRYETRVVGSDTFKSTAEKLPLLGVADQLAMRDLNAAWAEKRLGDNLPALIEASLARISPEIRSKLAENRETEKTRLFDTHPSDRKRIQGALAENAAGIFHDERPARILFRDYDETCRVASMDLYAACLGHKIAHGELVPTHELIGERSVVDKAHEAIERLSHGYFRVHRPLRFHFGAVAPPVNPRETFEQLRRSREAFAQSGDAVRTAFDRFDKAEGRRQTCVGLLALVEAGFQIPKSVAGVKLRNPDAIRAMQEEAQAEQAEVEAILQATEELIRQRIVAAIQLMHAPQVAVRLPKAGAYLANAEKVIDALRIFEDALPTLVKVIRARAALEALLRELGKEPSEQHVSKIRSVAGRLATHMRSVLGMLASATYPFKHGHSQATLGQYALAMVPEKDQLGDLFRAADELQGRLFEFHHRAVGTLALMAEQVEHALELPPLPAPKLAE